MNKVAVLGAGINGLACAVKIKEKFPSAHVVLFSDEFSPNTTGDGSGGLWYPFLCGKTSEDLICKWGCETYRFLHELFLEGGFEIGLAPLFELYRETRDLSTYEWTKHVFGHRILKSDELNKLSILFNNNYLSGRTYTTFTVNPPTMLTYLCKRFTYVDGKIVNHKVTSLDDPRLSGFNVVVNCLGLGARDVVPDDKVFSIRGQVMRVVAPWISQVVFDENTDNYIIPNYDFCILGGTHQENDYNTNIYDEDTKFILNGCKALFPGLEDAEVTKHWVGLRPGREQIRLEAEKRNGKVFIHNYGHGGSGFTLFWGCGSEVLKLFEENVMERKSKL